MLHCDKVILPLRLLCDNSQCLYFYSVDIGGGGGNADVQCTLLYLAMILIETMAETMLINSHCTLPHGLMVHPVTSTPKFLGQLC